jgi:excisionase family DNA binding protein
MPRELSIKEVCERLSLDHKTVRKMIADGDLEARRYPPNSQRGVLRITEDAVEDLRAAALIVQVPEPAARTTKIARVARRRGAAPAPAMRVVNPRRVAA